MVETSENDQDDLLLQIALHLTCDAPKGSGSSSAILRFTELAQVVPSAAKEGEEERRAVTPNFLAALESKDSSVTRLSCTSSTGSVMSMIQAKANTPYIFALDAPIGASLRVLTQSTGATPKFITVLDAAALCSDKSWYKVSQLSGEFPAMVPMDLQVIGRCRLTPSQESGQFVATVRLSDGLLHRYLQVFCVDHLTGKKTRVDSALNHNGQWIGPLEWQNSSPQDLVLVLMSPPTAALEGGSFSLQVAFDPATVQGDIENTIGSRIRQQFKGSYLPNRRRIIFRDVLNPVPSALSLRLSLSPANYIPFTLQVVQQDLQAQGSSGSIGPNDQILAQTESYMLSDGSGCVADLDWLPPECMAGSEGGNRILLQGIINSPEWEAREPYWDIAQVPKETAEQDSEESGEDEMTQNEAQNTAGSCGWTLKSTCALESGLNISRDTAWENSVAKIHAQWESAGDDRLQSAVAARKEYIRFASGELNESKTQEDSNDNAEEENAHTALRRKMRSLVGKKIDPNGQIVVRRCPVLTSDEEECIDFYAALNQENQQDDQQQQEEEEGQGGEEQTDEKKDSDPVPLISSEKVLESRQSFTRWFEEYKARRESEFGSFE